MAAGSLSAAARAMRISPAMVSRRLARLEARLGTRLINRTTRKLALTDVGHRFHADVVAILRAVRDAETRVAGEREEPRGALRVSAPTSFGRLHVAPHLGEFLGRWPRIDLQFDLGDEFVDLVTDRVDLAIRITGSVPATLTGRRLMGNRRVLCASPAYGERHGMPADIASLGRHRLLAAAGQLPWRLTDGVRRVQVDGTSHVRTNSSEIVRELALAGVGIALRSLWDVGALLAGGSLVRVLPTWQGPSDLGVYAVHPRTPAAAPSVAAPAIAAFVSFLQDRLATIDADG